MRTPLTANQLSVMLVAVGLLLGLAVQHRPLLAGVLGGFLSLAASILDGCDGEIARLKYQESALGCWIETFGDYSYYIAIFIGLTVGAVRQTGLGGLLLGRRRWRWPGRCVTFALLIYLRARITNGQPEPAARRRASDRFKAEPTVLVADHLADLVRRHPRRDALRHHGVRAAQPPAGDRRPGRHRRQHLLDQPRPEAADLLATRDGAADCGCGSDCD